MNGTELELRDYLRVLLRRKLFVLLAMVACTGGAIAASAMQTPIFQATAKIFVGPKTVDRRDVLQFQSAFFFRDIALSYVEELQSTPRAERAVEHAGVELPPEEVASRVKAEVITDTRVIRVSVRDTSPARARRIADGLVETFVADVNAPLDPRSDRAATVLQPAQLPTTPVSPKPLRNATLGFVLGSMLGVGLAFLVEYLDRTIRTREDAETAIDLPVLTTIPHAPAGANPSEASESFRVLRTNLQFIAFDDATHTLLVTSPGPDEGKTTVAANLAVAFALASARTLLVDADMRHAELHNLFELPLEPGLSSVLRRACDPRHAINASQIDNLFVLTAGPLPSNPTELLSGEGAKEFLAWATEEYDVVLLDSPPALGIADAAALAASADGALLVLRAGHTPRPAVLHAKAGLQRVGGKLLGVVLNDLATTDDGYGYGRYYGSYGYAQRRQERRSVIPRWAFPRW